MAAPANASQGRKVRGDFYRPAASTQIATGVSLLSGTGASSVGAKNSDTNGQVDLTLPLRGLRFVFKFRVTIGTANYTSANPESFFNLVSKIRVTGNFRGNGKTILDCSLASLFGFLNLCKFSIGYIQVNGVIVSRPGVPYTALAALTTAASPYDVIISMDVPFGPIGWKKRTGASFIMRDGDWTNINIHTESPALPDNATNALGVSAATSTTSVSAFGSATGAMTMDVYGLPVRLGKAASGIIPGLCTKTEVQINSATLQAAMSGAQLALLDKQSTSKVFTKFGTGTIFPFFATLSDLVANQLGILIGTDTNVRQLQDVQAVRSELANEFETPGTQGYFGFDFISQDENFDSAYPGDGLKDNQPFRLLGTGPGTVNAQGSLLQEEILVHPQGILLG